MVWVSGVEPQPDEFIDFHGCPIRLTSTPLSATPLREHPLLISLVFIMFLSEPYWGGLLVSGAVRVASPLGDTTAHEGFQSMYDCPKSRFRMMSNHIDARSWVLSETHAEETSA
jgi:hypothetical protein